LIYIKGRKLKRKKKEGNLKLDRKNRKERKEGEE
jgi:hypothetical protein